MVEPSEQIKQRAEIIALAVLEPVEQEEVRRLVIKALVNQHEQLGRELREAIYAVPPLTTACAELRDDILVAIDKTLEGRK